MRIPAYYNVQVTTDVITIIDNLMEADSKELAVAQEQNGTSSRAMRVLEKQLEYVDLSQGNGSFKAVQPNIGVQVRVLIPPRNWVLGQFWV